MYGQVYLITNTVNGKRYVGQTTYPLHERWQSHKTASRNPKTALHSALRKYGLNKFTIEQIDTADSQESLNKAEDFYILVLGTLASDIGYNLKRGGNNAPISESTKEKMRLVKVGVSKTPETRAKMSAYQLSISEEKSQRMLGEKNPFFGRKHAEETLVKLRGRTVSEDTRRKQSEARSGEKWWKFRKDVPTSRIVELYSTGISARKVAEIVGLHDSTVWLRLKKAGALRSQKGA